MLPPVPVAPEQLPAASGTLTLTAAQYANFCIRPTGTATAGAPTIVFPDQSGGYTKELDLTQVASLNLSTSITIKAGAGGGAKTTTLNAPARTIYVVNYDGTTISVSQSASNANNLNVGPVTTGLTKVSVLSGGAQSVVVGSSGTILGFFTSNLQFAAEGDLMEVEYFLDGSAQATSQITQQCPAFSLSNYSTSIANNYVFTGLTPGSTHTVDIQMSTTNPGNDFAYHNVLILISP